MSPRAKHPNDVPTSDAKASTLRVPGRARTAKLPSDTPLQASDSERLGALAKEYASAEAAALSDVASERVRAHASWSRAHTRLERTQRDLTEGLENARRRRAGSPVLRRLARLAAALQDVIDALAAARATLSSPPGSATEDTPQRDDESVVRSAMGATYAWASYVAAAACERVEVKHPSTAGLRREERTAAHAHDLDRLLGIGLDDTADPRPSGEQARRRLNEAVARVRRALTA